MMYKSIWFNLTIALLAMTLAMGVVTVWQVSLFAPLRLVQLSMVIFVAYSVLLVLSLRRVRSAFLANTLMAMIVLWGTFSSRTHFEFSESPAMIAAAAVVVVSVPVQILLAVTSFWRTWF